MNNIIKVLSFNIGGFYSQRERKYDWEFRRSGNLKVIRKLLPDIVCLQEVQHGNIVFYEENLKDYTMYKGVQNFSRDDKNTMYNVILWNKNIFSKQVCGGFYLSETPNRWSKSWDSMFVRSATWVKLKFNKTGTDFFFYNTHLDHFSEFARVESSNLIIDKALKTSKTHCAPIIITGDFNSRPWAPEKENAQMYPKTIIFNSLPPAGRVYDRYLQNGFIDTYIETGGENILNMNTYHDFKGKHFPPAALRIDWILKLDVNKKLKTKKFSVILEEDNEITPSDHYPVVADFILEK